MVAGAVEVREGTLINPEVAVEQIDALHVRGGQGQGKIYVYTSAVYSVVPEN